MRLKNYLIAFSILFLLTSLAYAGEQEFSQNSLYITPQVGINTFTIPFGLNIEYALTPNIGIGGTTMMWLWNEAFWSSSVIALSAEGTYHFTQLDLEKFDVFAGAGIGFGIYSFKEKTGFIEGAGTSGILVDIFVGGRYYFNPKFAVSLKVGGGLTTWSTFGAVIGVTIRP